MKRILSSLITMVIVFALVLPCAATGEEISITNADVQPGEKIYLCVTLNEALKGDSIGVQYTFDSSLLKDLYKECTWERTGTIQDFTYRQNGVWAASSEENLKGDIFTLAFKVRDNVSFTETNVTCYVIIKNGDQVAGEYTVEAKVSMTCDHSYGGIVSEGEIGHSNRCELCGYTVTNAHQWEDGEKVEDPDNQNIILQISVCTVCGEQKKTPIELKQEGVDTTEPTSPTSGEEIPSDTTAPTETTPESTHPELPTKPKEPEHHDDPQKQPEKETTPSDREEIVDNDKNTQNQQGDINSKDEDKTVGNDKNTESDDRDVKDTPDSIVPNGGEGEGHDEYDGHDHETGDFDGKETVPKDVLENEGDDLGDHESHQHEHSEEEPQKLSVGGVIVLSLIVVLMVGLPIYIFKGKKRI